jgi:hypothetical protein
VICVASNPPDEQGWLDLAAVNVGARQMLYGSGSPVTWTLKFLEK